jgi:hypothetical protein
MRSLLLVPLLLLGCRNPLEVSDCPDQLEIVVSSGTRPTIDWTPRCHLYALYVQAPGDYNLWSIHGPPRLIVCGDDGQPCPPGINTLYPPIGYGVVPREAFQDLPPPAETAPSLVAGYPYTFRLYRTGDQFAVAVDTITISP